MTWRKACVGWRGSAFGTTCGTVLARRCMNGSAGTGSAGGRAVTCRPTAPAGIWPHPAARRAVCGRAGAPCGLGRGRRHLVRRADPALPPTCLRPLRRPLFLQAAPLPERGHATVAQSPPPPLVPAGCASPAARLGADKHVAGDIPPLPRPSPPQAATPDRSAIASLARASPSPGPALLRAPPAPRDRLHPGAPPPPPIRIRTLLV